jgi:hypothetical protein
MEQAMTTTIDAPPVAVLSVQMQTYAQGYIDARKRAGYAWLDMGRFLSEARAEAKHGEWSVFLEATQTGEDSAKRLIAIYAQSLHDQRFADAMRANFLSVATGYELISAPADVQTRLLSGDTPPTQRQIRDEKQTAKSAAPPTLEVAPFWQSMSLNHPTAHLWTRERPDLWRSACGIVTQNRAPSGSTEAGHCSSCVRATWPQNQVAPAEPNSSTDRAIPADLKGWHWMSGKTDEFQLTNGDYQTRVYDHPHHAIVGARNYLASQQPAEPTPDLADILLRLDAHGYAKSGTRQKGITTFYSFRDYRSTLDDGQVGELELAEGELVFWLAELDSNAAYAQAKQEKYLSQRDRAERLGYDLKRDGAQFVLTPAGQQVPAMRGTLDQLIKALDGYEKSAAKQAAAAPVPTLAELDQLGMPVDLHNAGYFWRSAAPPTIESSSGWRGDAPTVDGAIEVARIHKDAKGEPLTVFPALTPLECKALLREARQFIASGLDKKLPTIGQALRIAARMALEATE